MARRKYKSWGNYQQQTVRQNITTPLGQTKQVVIRQGFGCIAVNREEIPSLINALLAIGDLK